MEKQGQELVSYLRNKAADIRIRLIEYNRRIGDCHLGGPLSMCDMVVALYYHFMKTDKNQIGWEDRDRFILSKGHCGCLICNILADQGYYTFEEMFAEYNQVGGRFGQHPNRLYLPMFDASTGSLGHGLSIAVGMALAGRMDQKKYRVFCMTGDAELNEGSNWEAMMAGAHYQLGNLVLIVDRNHFTSCKETEDIMGIDPLDQKLTSFGWEVVRVNGNNMNSVVHALSSLPPSDSRIRRKPIAILSDTVKGYGVSFMAANGKWHTGKVTDELLEEALKSIELTRNI